MPQVPCGHIEMRATILCKHIRKLFFRITMQILLIPLTTPSSAASASRCRLETLPTVCAVRPVEPLQTTRNGAMWIPTCEYRTSK